MAHPSVLFVAPGLRRGSGGVADYSRLLAQSLSERGIECHLVSWNESPEDAGSDLSLGGHTLFLQERPDTPIAAKVARLHAYVEQHEINWISLQFVNFGFAKRGLIGGLAAALAPVLRGRRVHVFLHELWVQPRSATDISHKILGAVQRRQLLHFLRALAPEQVWTSIELYAAQLGQHGIRASVLPIPGNIPVTTARNDKFILQKLRAELPRDECYLVGIFGAIHHSWPFRKVVPAVMRSAGGRRAVFVLFGRNGDGGAFRQYVDSLPAAESLWLGELDEEMIDSVINSMDAALATTPAEGIFKSGSAVAFLERGIPTVAVSGRFKTETAATMKHPCLILLDDSLEQALAAFRGAPRRTEPMFPIVANRYSELFATSSQRTARPPVLA